MKHNFQYISKHDPEVEKSFHNLVSLINEVQNLTRANFTFQFTPVGSYSRNMITYDTKSNIGFDFDIDIEVNENQCKYSAKQIREIIQSALNKVSYKYGYDYPEGSTRVLTIKVKDRRNSRILYSCDFAVVNNYEDEDGYDCQEYIRYNKRQNSYIWCEQPNGYYMLPEKIEWIKDNQLWNALREWYTCKKNYNEDPNMHSRTIFANSVQEICQKYGYYME